MAKEMTESKCQGLYKNLIRMLDEGGRRRPKTYLQELWLTERCTKDLDKNGGVAALRKDYHETIRSAGGDELLRAATDLDAVLTEADNVQLRWVIEHYTTWDRTVLVGALTFKNKLRYYGSHMGQQVFTPLVATGAGGWVSGRLAAHGMANAWNKQHGPGDKPSL